LKLVKNQAVDDSFVNGRARSESPQDKAWLRKGESSHAGKAHFGAKRRAPRRRAV